ncbi:MAG TPA: efflux RND transporter periplasmic adaptor subunit [Verrucomicrobiae bacterium]
MKRKLLSGIIIVVAVAGGLAAVKTLQIKKLISTAHPVPMETIASAVAHEENWPDTLPAVGSVSAAQGVTVAPEIGGMVMEIAFESGAFVQPGDLLVRLDTSSEEAQLRAAEAQTELARLNAERNRKLREDKTVSQAELDATEATLKQAQANADAIHATIAKKTIRAPFAGKLGIRLVNLGEQLNVGQGIVSLQSLSPVFVDFSLPQQEFAKLQTGLKVRAFLDAYPTNHFEGELAAINPDLDPVTRCVRIRAKFENAGELLRAGMFARVSVILPEEKPVLVVPSTAVMSAPFGDSVFVITPDGQAGSTNLVAQQKFIRTGRMHGDFVSVETGLKAGDKVATAGLFKLRNGVSVRENNEMTPKPSLSPNPPNS